MNEYANALKETLTSLIREMSTEPAPFVKNPENDFTRKKKLPFETVMHLLISHPRDIRKNDPVQFR
ncbi:hypothetical protein [Paenibacillus sp. P32E]|uniref:hypothetical protein n=1 Tax=Paenibacillus sp. P32E TaxID=1349434 RepID=UPI00094057BC|nr:hypothetical protein [Paenibacillus sp. P32E]OKP94684.1 hypothetical protein A3848_01495 [Paenibacillus sp. P32E]